MQIDFRNIQILITLMTGLLAKLQIGIVFISLLSQFPDFWNKFSGLLAYTNSWRKIMVHLIIPLGVGF